MSIFIAELLCCGGAIGLSSEQLPDSLIAEATAMWRSIIEDAAQFTDVVTLIDQSFIAPQTVDFDNVETGSFADHRHAGSDVWEAWSNIARSRSCESMLVIAPEVVDQYANVDPNRRSLADGIDFLRRRGHRVIAADDRILRLAADKWRLAEVLRDCGLPHPFTLSYEASRDVNDGSETRSPSDFGVGIDSQSGWIVKPQFGFGSQSIRLHQAFLEAQSDCQPGEIIQLFVGGETMSIAAVIGPGGIEWLPAVRQHLDPQTFVYVSASGDVDADRDRRCRQIGSRTIEGLGITQGGYIGFDIVLGERAEQDRLIEINARLTTSYVQLRRMVPFNIAERMH